MAPLGEAIKYRIDSIDMVSEDFYNLKEVLSMRGLSEEDSIQEVIGHKTRTLYKWDAANSEWQMLN